MNGHGVEQIVYFVVIAIIAIARALSRGKRDTSTPTPPPGPPIRTSRPLADTEQERQRRFREALGLPPASVTPPPVKPRTAVNPPPLQPIPPMGPRRIYTGVPRRANAPAPQPAPVVPAPIPVSWVPESPQTMVAPAPIEPLAPLLPARRTSTAPALSAAAASPQQSFPASALLLSLRDPASIRRAIILREVLGLPKALQPSLIGAGTLWSGH